LSPQAFLYSKLVQYGPGWFMLVEAGEFCDCFFGVQKCWLLLERNYPNVVFQPSFSDAMLVLGRAFWERFFKTWKQIA